MKLPAEFEKRMRDRLGKQFPDFLRVYEEPVCRGIRVNTLKLSAEEFAAISPFSLRPVPWEQDGFYVTEEKVGAHPFHFAGLFYSQEPSAMCAVPLLGVQPGEKVLDLCAAPGGKTTQIAQAMRGEGVLVANEYVFPRARALLQNVERLGVTNCMVTNCDPSVLAERFPAAFDKILVDAPCSGEGMFRREEKAIAEWSEENVARCVPRQRAILGNAAEMLRPGGKLVYSTCTFSEEEDEEQVAWFLGAHPDFYLLEQKKLYPHRVEGEGHFAALFCREGDAPGAQVFSPRRGPLSPAAARAFSEFSEGFFAEKKDFRLCSLPGDGEEGRGDERLFALPEEMPQTRLSCLRAGVFLGWCAGTRFTPAHALAMSLKRKEVRRFVSLAEGEAIRYLCGETVEAFSENGWCVVGAGDYPIGIGKAVNGRIKNHLPKGLRRTERT